jgi:hypothetical protein
LAIVPVYTITLPLSTSSARSLQSAVSCGNAQCHGNFETPSVVHINRIDEQSGCAGVNWWQALRVSHPQVDQQWLGQVGEGALWQMVLKMGVTFILQGQVPATQRWSLPRWEPETVNISGSLKQ